MLKIQKKNRVAILIMCLSFWYTIRCVWSGFLSFFFYECICNNRVTLIQGHGNRCWININAFQWQPAHVFHLTYMKNQNKVGDGKLCVEKKDWDVSMFVCSKLHGRIVNFFFVMMMTENMDYEIVKMYKDKSATDKKNEVLSLCYLFPSKINFILVWLCPTYIVTLKILHLNAVTLFS